MAVLSSFCGLLTLQVGAVILAVVFFTLSGMILAANIFTYRNTIDGWPLNLILMIIFVLGLIIIGVFMFLSAYSEARRSAVIAAIGLVILLCYWIILCCFSFFGASVHTRGTCIDTRCPESLWVVNLGYRRREDKTPSNSTSAALRYRRHDEIAYLRTGRETQAFLGVQKTQAKNDNETLNNSTNRTAESRQKTATDRPTDTGGYFHYAQPLFLNVEKYLEIDIIPDGNITKVKVITDSVGYNSPDNFTTFKQTYFHNKNSPYKMYFTLNETSDDDEDSSGIVYGFPFSGAVILFFANLLFLIFSALIMCSWASELDWADYYIEEDPVVYEKE